MIISDLNYLEEVHQENAVVGGSIITVDKDVSFSTTVTQDFDVDVDMDINKDISASLTFNVTASKGNVAGLTFDVTASGNNSFTEGDLSIVTTSNLSELSGTFVSAVD